MQQLFDTQNNNKAFWCAFFFVHEIYLESEINKPLKSCINKTELQMVIVSI